MKVQDRVTMKNPNMSGWKWGAISGTVVELLDGVVRVRWDVAGTTGRCWQSDLVISCGK